MTSTRQQRLTTPSRPRAPAGHRSLLLADDVAQSLTDGVLILTPTGGVLQANDAVHALLAVEDGNAEDLVGRDGPVLFDRVIGSDGRALSGEDNPVRACLRTGRSMRQTVGVVQPDGGVMWVGVSVTPVRTRSSAAPAAPPLALVDGLVVVLSRLGPDAAIMAALRDRDHQLSIAQRMAGLAMWRLNMLNGTIEPLNPGRSVNRVITPISLATYLTGLHPDDRQAHDALLESLLCGAEPTGEMEVRYRSEVDWRHLHLWAEAVVDQNGSVTALWGTTQEVTERRQAEAAVRRLAMTDSLTELANRAQVLERHSTALVECPLPLEVGLVVIDIDRFTLVNDGYGPSVGDLLLIEVGRRLLRLGATYRTPGRLGADQFALVLERSTPAQATQLATWAWHELSQPYELAGVGAPFEVTVSVGAVMSTRDVPQTTSELLRQSEIAVSIAKSAGGGRVVVFDAELRSQVLGRLDMEGRLRAAIGSGSLFPLYQPVLTLGPCAAQDRFTSCEALARMDGGDGVIPPSEFVGVAEERGLILDLDLVIFAEAVRRVLVDPPVDGFALAVNISPLTLQAAGLSDRVAAVLQRHGLDGTSLRIEITESCLAEPTPTLLANLRGMRETGAQIGLDDFGTGYSALGYLSRFDLDFMKIDRSFITEIGTDVRSRAVVRAVIDLAHAHDLFVVAEGIETADQLEAIRDMRCDMAQGFYLGRPMPLPEMSRLVAAGSRSSR